MVTRRYLGNGFGRYPYSRVVVEGEEIIMRNAVRIDDGKASGMAIRIVERARAIFS